MHNQKVPLRKMKKGSHLLTRERRGDTWLVVTRARLKEERVFCVGNEEVRREGELLYSIAQDEAVTRK